MLLHKTLARGNYFATEESRIARKPPARAYVSGWTRAAGDFTALGHEYILRACALVRAGKLGVLLASAGPDHYWIGEAADPWGTKRLIACDDLRDLIDSIDVAMEVNAA